MTKTTSTTKTATTTTTTATTTATPKIQNYLKQSGCDLIIIGLGAKNLIILGRFPASIIFERLLIFFRLSDSIILNIATPG